MGEEEATRERKTERKKEINKHVETEEEPQIIIIF